MPNRANRGYFGWVRVFAALFLVLLFGAGQLGAQRGAITRLRNLGELVDRSAIILRGHVVSARVEPHPELRHLATLVVTLRVNEALKGQPGEVFTFRQFIWDIRDRMDMAGYKKGQEWLLLLNPPTRYGLTSPAGLEQGRFRILRDAQGRANAVNGYGNAGLFRSLASQMKAKGLHLTPELETRLAQPSPGRVPLDELRSLIKQLTGAN